MGKDKQIIVDIKGNMRHWDDVLSNARRGSRYYPMEEEALINASNGNHGTEEYYLADTNSYKIISYGDWLAHNKPKTLSEYNGCGKRVLDSEEFNVKRI